MRLPLKYSLTITVMLMLCGTPACAQLRTFWQQVDDWLIMRQNKQVYDTNYISRPPERWTVKLRANLSGWEIRTEGMQNQEKYIGHYTAAHKATLSGAVSYRGVAVGLALNPAKLAGLNKDFEVNINSYGNKVGADVIYQSARNFNGEMKHGGNSYDVRHLLQNTNMLNVNTYYAFNNRQFSYPAAFTQSFIQKRSAGSWLLGASFIMANVSTNADPLIGNPASRLRMSTLGFGGGYGYNYVTHNHWLLHASALPTIVMLNASRLIINDERQHMAFYFPDIQFSGRLAVIRSFSHSFVGMTLVASDMAMGNREVFRTYSAKWRARLVLGYRFK